MVVGFVCGPDPATCVLMIGEQVLGGEKKVKENLSVLSYPS